MPSVDSAIRSMCVGEMEIWASGHLDYREACTEYEELNVRFHHVFLFRISGGQVSIVAKDNFYTQDQIGTDRSQPAFSNLPSWLRNAIYYRELLGIVAKTICPELDTLVAVDVGDRGLSSKTVPLFGVAKTLGSSNVLLPHFEFVMEDFHADIVDTIPYSEKAESAMFVGSTTGLEPITVDVVKRLGFQRLRSAVFFKDDPKVDFRLAQIVQATPEAEQLLREMGFGTGSCQFEEHFRNKFIISMDGNAGSCSRVNLALKSNCVLVKYESPYIMHYFANLVPWLHYVPVTSDNDLSAVLEIETRHPGFFNYIAMEGKKFFDAYLTKQQIINYTGALLRMYVEIFNYSSQGGRNVIMRIPADDGAQPPTRIGTRQMVSRSDVIAAYRTMLGRDPEDEQVVQDHLTVPSVPDLYRIIMESDEFREVFRTAYDASAWPNPQESLTWPPLSIESKCSDSGQLAAMFARVSAGWARYGQQEPHFAVYTDPSLRGTEIGAQAEAFYASGQEDVRILTSFAARSRIELAGRTCLELGCGVGRVTRWLAPLFDQVQAADVSAPHLAIAQQVLAEAGVENISLIRIGGLSDLRQIFGYNLFFSVITLQHNPPPVIAYILMQALTNLNPAGVALFQLSTYRLGYWFGTYEYLNAPIPDGSELEMHVLPQGDVLKIIDATGCRLLELREDGYTDEREGISNTFFVEKRA